MAEIETLLEPLVQSELLGPLLQNEYGMFAFVIATFVAIGGVFHFVLKGFFHGLTKRTKTDIDDKIYDVLKVPVFAIINIYGAFLALTTLSALEQYVELIEAGFFIASVLIATLVASKIVNLLVSRMMRAVSGEKKTPNLLMKVINIIIYLAAFLLVLNHFNVDITAGIAALGVGGIAVGLALQGTITNFFSGVHIVTDRPIRVGDYIEIPGQNVEGYVLDVGWRSTRIRTLPNNIIIIPNSKLAESIVINNYLLDKEMGFVVDCGVDYGSDLDKVEKIAMEVARDVQKTVPGAIRDFEPLFRFKSFGDSNINFYVVLRVTEFINKYSVQSEFVKRLKARFDEEGIEISWPVRKVYTMRGK